MDTPFVETLLVFPDHIGRPMGHGQATHSGRRAVPTAPPQFGRHRTHCSSRHHAQGNANHNLQTEAALPYRYKYRAT